ncbi:YaaC family protein [Lactobacillus kullabergensis]|uniref:YaaC-like Protein n=1 Tax=Lactobacillus kullabergensis TaxID=1218493 RepID=A0ABM6W1N7_9LACO|nr:YaaC family protein [Lactobacillus kullabergensis]AWM75807.1 hypothetical protein DKL58_07390 [Lactobacillus kullabergensis]
MKRQIIFSENPIRDLWVNIEKYSYPYNIKKYLKNKEASEKLINSISGSILQAKEFFNASTHVTIQTSPILLYYGTINLLFASSALLTGIVPEINGHGLTLKKDDIYKTDLLKLSITVHNGKKDGFAYYYQSLEKKLLNSSEIWTIQDCLSAIPELAFQFINQFGITKTHIIPVNRIVTNDDTAFVTKSEIIDFSTLELLIDNDKKYNKNYFKPERNFKGGAVLRKKLNGKSLIKSAYNGQYYLTVSFNEVNDLSEKIYGLFGSYIALFGLCTLCRYYPQIWTPYIRQDPSGDVNYIKVFLSYIHRYIPNIILDYIENTKHIYSSSLLLSDHKTDN